MICEVAIHRFKDAHDTLPLRGSNSNGDFALLEHPRKVLWRFLFTKTLRIEAPVPSVTFHAVLVPCFCGLYSHLFCSPSDQPTGLAT